jgi:tRNA(Ile)-lysidine synthase
LSAFPETISDHQPLGGREAAALFSGLAAESDLLVAVSGGPDSVALLALLAEWAQEPGRPMLHAATVDHGLRAASSDEAGEVATLCGWLGVSHRILRWEGHKPATGIQARARAARYGLLRDEADRLGGATLVTAHTLDDQAETLLMRIAHGSGPSGLAAMRERVRMGALTLVRPLLCVPKARLVATAQSKGLAFVTDPSNSDPRFERVRWRELMPDLADQGLSAERLALLARRIARLDDAAHAQAKALLPQLQLAAPMGSAPVLRLRFAALSAEQEEIALRVLALALEQVGAEAGAVPRLERLEACVAALLAAVRAGEGASRTLSGCLLSLGRDGILTLRREGPRRRGVHPATA